VRIWPHARLHAHHRPGLAHRTARTGYAWMHTGRHLLARVGSGTAHGVAMRHALRVHAGAGIACGHHLAHSSPQDSARAVAMRARLEWAEKGRNFVRTILIVQRNRVENAVRCVLSVAMHAHLSRLDYVRYNVKRCCRANCNTLTGGPESPMQS
jgi:hypothetical protein